MHTKNLLQKKLQLTNNYFSNLEIINNNFIQQSSFYVYRKSSTQANRLKAKENKAGAEWKNHIKLPSLLTIT